MVASAQYLIIAGTTVHICLKCPPARSLGTEFNLTRNARFRHGRVSLLSYNKITDLDDNDDFQPVQFPSSPNKRRRTVAADHAQDEESKALTCPICMEAMRNSGANAITSLKCGHLFCEGCLLDWFGTAMKKRGVATCPQCKAVFKKADLRRICTPNIMVYDTTEFERMKAQAQDSRRRADEAEKAVRTLNMAATQYRRWMSELNQKNEALEAEIQTLKTQLQSLVGTVHEEPSAASSRKAFEKFHLALLPCQMTGRTVALSGVEEMAVVSAGSAAHGYGIQRISMRDTTVIDFFVNHDKMIRDIKLSPFQHSLVLSTGIDRMLALSCAKNKHTLQRYTLERPAWSCAFDSSDPNTIYCGLANNVIAVYDIRNTKQHIATLQSRAANYGIHSITAATLGSKKLLLCSNTVESYIWELPKEGDPILHNIPDDPDGYKPYSLNYRGDTQTVMISSRRSKSQHGHGGTRHTLFALKDEDVVLAERRWEVEDAIEQPLMARTCHFGWDDEVVACFGTSDGACIRDRARQRQSMEIEKPVLDVKAEPMGDDTIVAALTDTGLHLYK